MPRRLLPAAAAAAMLACVPPADAIELVRDINATFAAGSSAFAGVYGVLSPSSALTVLDDGIHGAELWITDGTPAGTRLLRDINPGSAESEIRAFVIVNGIAYFQARDATNGAELWRSDGTEAGTWLVANVGPGAADMGVLGPEALVPMNNVLYFIGNDGQTGNELWRSDGTRTGTWRVMDIRPGAEDSFPLNIRVVGSRLFFHADDGATGYEPWISDGTPAGTQRIANIMPGVFGSGFGGGFVLGSSFFFAANDDAHGEELWRVSLTGTNPQMVVDLNTVPQSPTDPRTLSSNPRLMGIVGNRLVLLATTLEGPTPASRQPVTRLYSVTETASQLTPILQFTQFEGPMEELFIVGGRLVFHRFNHGIWSTDGTAAGTMPLPVGGTALFSDSTTVNGGTLETPNETFFYARLGPIVSAPISLWRTDGTPAGTRLQANLPEPFQSGEPVLFNGRIYFSAGSFDDGAGAELWVSDPATTGAQRAVDVNPGSSGSQLMSLQVVLGRLMFIARTEATGFEPYASDGTEAGTVRLGDINGTRVTPGSSPSSLRQYGSRLLFFADDGVSGGELWSSDGTMAGTQMVADVAPGSESLFLPQWLGELSNGLLFVASDGISGREIWITDGTANGTRMVADIAPGAAGSDPAGFGAVFVGGVAYFEANDGNGVELWVTDGTAAGTRMVVALTPSTQGSMSMLGAANGRVLFRLQRAPEGELWVSDGTAGGTMQLRAGLVPHFTFRNAELDGFLYLFASENGVPQVWRTDGTEAGTTPLTTGSPGMIAENFARAGDRLLFNGCPGGNDCGVYSSDGTEAGTIRLLSGQADPVVNDGPLAYFLLNANGLARLFVTDGTVAGTRDFIPPRTVNLPPSSVVPFAGSVFFVVSTPEPQVWYSDGTPDGTGVYALLSDVAGELTPVGSRLFLVGGNPATGRELYSIASDRPFAQNDDVTTEFQTATAIRVLSNDTALAAPLNASSVVIVAAPGRGTTSISNGEIAYTPNTGFAGLDTFTYRVRDTLGVASNAARVTIIVAAQAGGDPGTAPQPPPPPPPPPPANGGGDSGGGGSMGWLALFMLLALRLRLLLPAAALLCLSFSISAAPLGRNAIQAIRATTFEVGTFTFSVPRRPAATDSPPARSGARAARSPRPTNARHPVRRPTTSGGSRSRSGHPGTESTRHRS